jgi:hypothetical protein
MVKLLLVDLENKHKVDLSPLDESFRAIIFVYVLTALSTTELATLFDRAKQLALAELDFTADAQSLLIGMRGKPRPSDLVA